MKLYIMNIENHFRFRAIVLYGKKVTVLKVGVLEIVNSVYFFVVTIALFQFMGGN